MIEKLIEIVKEAASLMVARDFEVTQKDGYANIVTSSDLAVQNFLCQKLSILLPNSGFLCEEDDINDLSQEYTWIIDPIDGTANYARGMDHCCISVGLKHNGKIVAGVVYIPHTNELFHAEIGKGAYRNGKRIHVSERPFADSVMCTALAVYHREYAKACSDIIYEAFMQLNDLRRYGSAATELCYLAMGRCELYFEYVLSPWDFSGASIILTEAGGCLCDLYGKAPDCFHPSTIIAANNRENLQRLYEIVEKHRV